MDSPLPLGEGIEGGAWRLPRRLALAAAALLGAALACDVSLSATVTPSTVVGTTVFSAIVWQDPGRAIDVVFIPDNDYGDMSVIANRQTFLDDVADLIDTGYFQNSGIANNLGLFNFWFMTATGDVQPPTTGICPIATWPDLTDAAFAEVILLVHLNDLRDCRWSNKATTEPASYRTVVHESSHAIFNLPDEYCCDGGYRNFSPVLYNSQAACTGDAANAAWRNCQSFTASSGTTWWRSEDMITDIMSGGGSVVLEYGQGDWAVAAAVLGALPGASVSPPDVFAPSTWDWP